MKLSRPQRVAPLIACASLLATCESPSPSPGVAVGGPPQVVTPLERPTLDPGVMITPADCQVQVQAITSLLRLQPERRREQVREVLRLAAMYDRLAAAALDDDSFERSCRKPLRDLGHELALLIHRRAQAEKDGEARMLAGELYQVYLDRFADQAPAYEMGFHYGELLWTMERWREAAERYDWVLAREPRGKLAEEAAYAALLAWNNVLESAKSAEAAGADGRAAPRSLSADDRRLVAAMDRYLALLPEGAQRVKIEYRRARLHHERGLYQEAIPLFQAIVTAHPDHELAVHSANLLLDCLNVLGRNRELLRWVDTFLASPTLMKDQEFAGQMRTIKSDLLEWASRQAHRSRGFALCARSLMAAAEVAPEHPRQAERLAGAVRCWRAAGRGGQAKRARQILSHSHPDHPLALGPALRPASAAR